MSGRKEGEDMPGGDVLVAIAGLAVLDMLSPTALAVTTVVLLTSRHRAPGLLAVYWVTVASAYFVLGVLLKLGLSAVIDVVDELVALWLQAAIGVGLLAASFFIADRSGERTTVRSTPRALTKPGMVVLGIGTWTFEAATAVPYFAAIALLSQAAVPASVWVPILAIYSALMLLPCVVVLVVWAMIGDRFQPRLERWRNRLTGASHTATSWIVGVAGLLVALDAAWRLLTAAGYVQLP